jgi:hypothetical protein
VPHPTALMKLTARCGSAAVDGLNEALSAKAAEAKLLRTSSQAVAEVHGVPHKDMRAPDRIRKDLTVPDSVGVHDRWNGNVFHGWFD